MIEVLNTLISFTVCLLLVALITNQALKERRPVLKETWFRGVIVLIAVGSLIHALDPQNGAGILTINLGLIGLVHWMYNRFINRSTE